MTKKLTPEDIHLWKTNTRDVKPLCEPIHQNDPESRPPSFATLPIKADKLPKEQRNNSHIHQPSLKRKEVRHLRYEAQLDMHGLTLERGYQVLKEFLSQAQTRGIKTALIITGKGSLGEERTFRHQVPRWIEEAPLRDLVLSLHHPAKLQDGGTGAFYVRVRRKKKPHPILKR